MRTSVCLLSSMQNQVLWAYASRASSAQNPKWTDLQCIQLVMVFSVVDWSYICPICIEPIDQLHGQLLDTPFERPHLREGEKKKWYQHYWATTSDGVLPGAMRWLGAPRNDPLKIASRRTKAESVFGTDLFLAKFQCKRFSVVFLPCPEVWLGWIITIHVTNRGQCRVTVVLAMILLIALGRWAAASTVGRIVQIVIQGFRCNFTQTI